MSTQRFNLDRFKRPDGTYDDALIAKEDHFGFMLRVLLAQIPEPEPPPEIASILSVLSNGGTVYAWAKPEQFAAVERALDCEGFASLARLQVAEDRAWATGRGGHVFVGPFRHDGPGAPMSAMPAPAPRRWFEVDTAEGGLVWVRAGTVDDALRETGTWATGYVATGRERDAEPVCTCGRRFLDLHRGHPFTLTEDEPMTKKIADNPTPHPDAATLLLRGIAALGRAFTGEHPAGQVYDVGLGSYRPETDEERERDAQIDESEAAWEAAVARYGYPPIGRKVVVGEDGWRDAETGEPVRGDGAP